MRMRNNAPQYNTLILNPEIATVCEIYNDTRPLNLVTSITFDPVVEQQNLGHAVIQEIGGHCGR